MINYSRKPSQTAEEIPIFLNKKLSTHLKHQIKYFSNEAVTDTDDYYLAPWQKSYVDRFLKEFGTPKGKLILDVGSGSGYMTIELAKLGAKIVSVDLTLKPLVRLKKIIKKLGLENKIQVACCDIQDLPFKKETFDYYISNAVLEHVEGEKKAINETNRVVKNGGGMMITVPIKYKYLNPILLPVNFIHDKRIGHLRRYDAENLKKKFKGWKLVGAYYTGHTRKVLKTIINMLSPMFSNSAIEKEDAKLSNKVRFSSNIIAFFKKAETKNEKKLNNKIRCLKCLKVGTVKFQDKKAVCSSCKQKYLFENGIPVLTLKGRLKVDYDY